MDYDKLKLVSNIVAIILSCLIVNSIDRCSSETDVIKEDTLIKSYQDSINRYKIISDSLLITTVSAKKQTINQTIIKNETKIIYLTTLDSTALDSAYASSKQRLKERYGNYLLSK